MKRLGEAVQSHCTLTTVVWEEKGQFITRILNFVSSFPVASSGRRHVNSPKLPG